MSHSINTEKYATWSREELIAKLLNYETGQQIQHDSISTTATTTSLSCDSDKTSTFKKSSKKSPRPFDMSKYSKRHIALKLAYFGWNYHGFAMNVNEQKFPTIEGHLHFALMNSKMILDPSKCNFSKCGRTDKGVSSLGQVVALDIRSNLPQDSPHVLPITPMNDGTPIKQDVTSTNEDGIKGKPKQIEEIPYIETLNRMLPDDIRIIAWAPVNSDFNARHDCRSRHYKYFFVKRNLDIDLMRNAAKRFLGTHDFRNFCKIDGAKQIDNFLRTILHVEIDLVQDQQNCSTDEFYVFDLKGTAFLWHQVRCMMAILFLVGQKLEEPSIIDDLLDIKKTPAKPIYNMASELPLVLYDCQYDNVKWHYGRDDNMFNTLSKLYKHIYEQWYGYATKSLLFSKLLNDLGGMSLKRFIHPGQELKNLPINTEQTLKELVSSDISTSSDNLSNIITGGGGKELRVRKYVKIASRETCDSAESKNEKYKVKRIKLE
ncbi:9996_t:CDS:1 [Scutellospora calospora]|uniref:9996_t:CDS:1 n=1 Tax=Scutellospora calospora TaxID=85575 RepID=A0ACA9L4B6_9GLOM|nr:9996_t:CDS:1 [Scutellospora calospora]